MASEIMLHDSTLFDKFFSHLLLITMIKAIILEVSKKNLKRTHAVSFRALFNETHATTYAAAIAVTLYCYFPKVKMLLINCNSLLSFFLHIFCLQIKACFCAFWGVLLCFQFRCSFSALLFIASFSILASNSSDEN